VLAFTLIKNPEIAGIAISLFDQGMTMNQASQLAIDAGLVRSLSGSDSNLSLAKLVFRNIVGFEAPESTALQLAGFMQGSGGSMSQADFLATAAQLELNQQHINLVGLQQTGIEFI
jgi:serralysin